MTGIYYFDLVAILITLALLASCLYKKMYINNSSKAYLIIISVLLIASIFDILSCFSNLFTIGWMTVITTGYHLFRNLLLVVYLIYVISLCEMERVIKRNKLVLILGLIPIIVVFTLILTNFFHHGIFYYDYINDSGATVDVMQYHRGPLITIIYANSVIYMGFTIFVVLKNRVLFTIREIISIFSIVPLSILSLVVQFVFKGFLVEMFTSALSAVLISITVERPDDYIDSEYLIGNQAAYIKEVKRAFLFKEKSSGLVVKVKNYYELYEYYSYDDSVLYVRKVINDIMKKYRQVDKGLQMFYIENGVFGISLSSYELTIKCANEMLKDAEKLKKAGSKFSPDFQFVATDVLEDFKKYDDFLFFVNNYTNRLSFKNPLTIYSEIKDDREFNIISNIDSIIDDGLKNNEFEVYYQPIYNVKDNKFYSAEALVRLNSEKYGFITPGLFIPYAEKIGKVIDIDKFVFEEVCKFIASDDYKKSGLKYIEYNLSMIDCTSPYLHSFIIFTMEKYGVTPDQINIEITESYDSLNEKIAKENITKLKEYGIQFSLDDYGTGYSNIERFSILPISFVKIDKSLVDSSEDSKMQIVLKNTFSLIKSLDRKTIVEGVETEEQSKRFKGFDCDNIQGYYYSKPLPYKSFIEFINEKNSISESE